MVVLVGLWPPGGAAVAVGAAVGAAAAVMVEVVEEDLYFEPLAAVSTMGMRAFSSGMEEYSRCSLQQACCSLVAAFLN